LIITSEFVLQLFKNRFQTIEASQSFSDLNNSSSKQSSKQIITTYITQRLFNIIHDIQRCLKVDDTDDSGQPEEEEKHQDSSEKEENNSDIRKSNAKNENPIAKLQALQPQMQNPALEFIKYISAVFSLHPALRYESIKLKKVCLYLIEQFTTFLT